MKFVLVFLVLFMVIAANMDDGMIAALGFDPDILKVALATWIVTGLIIYHNLALIELTVLLCIGVNLPQETLDSLGIDRQILMATLIVFVLTPKLKGMLES